MAFIPLLLTIPFAIVVTIVLNHFGNWAHQSSEQLRLDALVLSLCHQRRAFILREILPANEEIRATQIAMDAAATTYDADPEPETKAAAGAMLTALSVTGQAQEKALHFAISMYPVRERGAETELSEENRLDSMYGSLRSEPKISATGWRLEKLPSTSASLQKRHPLVPWPRTFEPDPETFDRAHQYHFEYFPIRKIVGFKESDPDWKGLQTFDRSTEKSYFPSQENHRFEALSFSGCRVLNGKNFPVKRLEE